MVDILVSQVPCMFVVFEVVAYMLEVSGEHCKKAWVGQLLASVVPSILVVVVAAGMLALMEHILAFRVLFEAVCRLA